MLRTSAPVRLRLSVSTSISTATPPGRVALVRDRLVGAALELAGAPLDGPVDGVVRSSDAALAFWNMVRRVALASSRRRPPGRRPRSGGPAWRTACPRALSAAPFLCLIVAHLEWPDIVSSPARLDVTISRNCSCSRRSPASSGWNDAASTRPWRPSTGRRRASASTSTPAPTGSTRGARMNTPWNGSPLEPGHVEVGLEAVDLAAVAVAAHGRGRWRRSCAGRARPSSTSVASRIMPAQVPNTGRPSASRRRAASNSPDDRAASTSWWTRRRASRGRRRRRGRRACGPRRVATRARRAGGVVRGERALQGQDPDASEPVTWRLRLHADVATSRARRSARRPRPCRCRSSARPGRG